MAGFLQLSALGDPGLGLLSQVAELGDEPIGLTREHLQGAAFHPLRAMVMVFSQETVGDFPQVLIGMDEIQDLGEIGELFGEARLPGFATIAQCYFGLDMAALAWDNLLGQAHQSCGFAFQGSKYTCFAAWDVGCFHPSGQKKLDTTCSSVRMAGAMV